MKDLILVCNLSVKTLHFSYKLGTPLQFLVFLEIFRCKTENIFQGGEEYIRSLVYHRRNIVIPRIFIRPLLIHHQ